MVMIVTTSLMKRLILFRLFRQAGEYRRRLQKIVFVRGFLVCLSHYGLA